MANKLYEETNISAIADAIRAKGVSGTMTVAQMPSKVAAIPTKETVTWHQCPEAVRNYLANVTYDPSDYTTSQIASYAPATAVLSNTKPIGKTVDGVTYYNEVPNVATPFSSTNTAGTLKPLDTLRWINSTTSNFRDIGGWNCDGGTVKYGMLFRGGEPVAADKNLAVNIIGIKHELQLRGEAEQPQAYSLWGIPFTGVKDYAWLTLTPIETWKTIFRCAFDTVAKGIPLYFHCAAGADRTGTVAVMLEALLGMSQSDIDKDYELTCFSTGTATDTQARRRNEDEYKNYISAIKAVPLVGGLSDTFRNRAVSFALSLGFTAAEINAFRDAMIDGNPSDITVTTTNVNVTNTLTNATSNNSASTVEKYARYSSIITPNSGYALAPDKISVTMGGTIITQNAARIETYPEEKAYVDIPLVNGNININVEATVPAPSWTNIWATPYKLNSRLNSSETDPTQNGAFISAWFPITASDMTGDIILRSNLDLFNYTNATTSGDYLRMYPSETAGTNVVGAFTLDQSAYFTKGYDAQTGIYTLTVKNLLFASHVSEIHYFRFCARVSSSAIDSSFFDGCILTLNEEF